MGKERSGGLENTSAQQRGDPFLMIVSKMTFVPGPGFIIHFTYTSSLTPSMVSLQIANLQIEIILWDKFHIHMKF